MMAIDDRIAVPRQADNHRIRRLIGGHVLLAVFPVLLAFVPADASFFPAVVGTMGSITIAQMMLLSFWGGFGNGKLGWRLAVVVLGITYAAAWSALGLFLSTAARQPINNASFTGYVALLGTAASVNSVTALLIVAGLLAVRRWSEMRFLPEMNDRATTATVQFSILNILVITTVAAVLFAFMRGARRNAGTDWQVVPLLALMISTYLIDALCAVWAALGLGRILWRVVLTLTVAALLGPLISITANQAPPWWLLLTWSVVSALSISIVLGSLLVVRSCGYRLVPRYPTNEDRDHTQLVDVERDL